MNFPSQKTLSTPHTRNSHITTGFIINDDAYNTLHRENEWGRELLKP